MLKKLLKKIKGIFKLVKYCKNCRYYIPFNEEIADYDICGFTIQTYKDIIGNIKARVGDNQKVCDECGTILEDERKIKYDKCMRRNFKNKCVDYRGLTIGNYILIIKTWIKGKAEAINERFNRNIVLMFVVWAILNVIFVLKIIEHNYILDIGYELIIGYIIISLVYFRYAIVIHKSTKQ